MQNAQESDKKKQDTGKKESELEVVDIDNIKSDNKASRNPENKNIKIVKKKTIRKGGKGKGTQKQPGEKLPAHILMQKRLEQLEKLEDDPPDKRNLNKKDSKKLVKKKTVIKKKKVQRKPKKEKEIEVIEVVDLAPLVDLIEKDKKEPKRVQFLVEDHPIKPLTTEEKEQKEKEEKEKQEDLEVDAVFKKRTGGGVRRKRSQVFLTANIAKKVRTKLESARTRLTPNFTVHGKQQRFCETSLYLFDSDNKFRYYCVWLVEWKWFEHFLTLCIMVNAINIATNDYTYRISGKKNDSALYVVKYYIDLIITIFFIIECITKVIAMGFIFGRGTYIADGWNKLDFIVVVTGLSSLVGFGKISAIRTLRLLRPLRSINKIEGLRILVNSILRSIPQIANVAAFLLFIITLQAVFGLHLFHGMYEYRCRLTKKPYANGSWPILEGYYKTCSLTNDKCPTGTYCGAPFEIGNEIPYNKTEMYNEHYNWGITNFDNIFSSFLTVFQCLTGEGWSFLMYVLWHTYAKVVVAGFFLLLILFGVFFVLNLFLAVIRNNFMKENQKVINAKKKFSKKMRIMKQKAKKIMDEQAQEDDNEAEIKLLGDKEEKVINLEEKSNENKGNSSMRKVEDDSIMEIELLDRDEKKEIKKIEHSSIIEEEEDDEKPKPILEMDLEKEKSRGKKLKKEVKEVSLNDENVKKSCRQHLRDFIESGYFISTSFILILSNTVVLAMDSYLMTPSRDELLTQINVYFTVIFALEMVFKIIAFGVKGYVRDPFNLFDGILVMISLVGMAIEIFSGTDSGKTNVITVFRSIRVLRIFKLASRSQNLLILLEAIKQTVKEILNYLFLLCLYIFIMALLGMELYSFRVRVDDNDNPVDVKDPTGFPPLQNFDTFFQAILTVFALLVNEDWHIIFYQYSRASSILKASVYFGVVVILGNFIILQLFLAILIENFSKANETISQEMKEKSKKGKKRKKRKKKKLSEFPFLYDLMQRRIAILDKKEKIKAKKKKMVCEGKSLYYFEPDNKCRKWCFELASHNGFETFIIITILVSTTSLSYQSPLLDPKSGIMQFWKKIDLVTTIIFTFECTVKIIATGFVLCGKNSYARNVANLFDFIIVVSALVSTAQGDGASKSLGALKILRIARIARPLRIISRSEGLTIAINSLVKSLPNMVNLFFFCFLIFFLFGIFGVNYFKGAFYDCDYTHVPAELQSMIVTMQDCMDLGGDWIRDDSNFDNIGQAMSTMFKIGMTEGWLQIMQKGVDCRPEKIPVRGLNKIWQVYFSLFLILGCFFILNLYDGIVIDSYSNEHDRVKIGIPNITAGQKLWISLQKVAGEIKPLEEISKPTEPWKLKVYNFVNQNIFEYFILAIILINMVIFMLYTHRLDDRIRYIFTIINYIIMFVFIIEAVLKLSCMGCKYFNDSWNVFDFSLIIISLSSMLFNMIGMQGGIGNKASLLRIFRLGRLLRLVNRAKNLRTIFDTFILTLPSLANIGLLLSLVIFIYMILGIELYAYTKLQFSLTEDANFQNIGSSFFTLFRVSTGEGWNFIMDDLLRQLQPNFICYPIGSYEEWLDHMYMGCGKSHATIYMVSFQIMFGIIFINLFVAVILNGFDDSQLFQEYNLSNADIDNFKQAWFRYDKQACGLISIHDINKLMLNIPLFSTKKLLVRLMDMMLPIIRITTKGEHEDYFLFQDVLCAVTHLTTQKTGEVDEDELKQMNKNNRINNRMEHLRTKQILELQKKFPNLSHLQYNSAHLAFVKILTQMIKKKYRKEQEVVNQIRVKKKVFKKKRLD